MFDGAVITPEYDMSLKTLKVKDAALVSDTFSGKLVTVVVPGLHVTVIDPVAGSVVEEQPANALLLAVVRMPAVVSDKATFWLRM